MDAIFLASAAATWALNKLLDHLKDSAIKALLRSEGLDREVGPIEVTLMRANLVLGSVPTGSAASGVRIRNKELINHVNKVHQHASFLANELDKVKYQCIKQEVKKKNLENASIFKSKMKSITQVGTSEQKISGYDIRLIKKTADELEKICNDVHEALVVEKLGQIVEATKNMDIDTRETVDSKTETEVVPREEENDIRQLITASASPHQQLLVLPIVGDGGVGKTTLARQVYNDQRVKDKFEMMIWIYVSANFDEVKVTQGILQQIPKCEYKPSTNLNVLQGSIKKHLTGKFLIVLDDMWEESQGRWEKLLAPLRCTEKGGVVLVTTRKLSVANATGRSNAPINLDGMKADMFWSFFQTCIFGHTDYRGKKLLKIGKEIATKLKGNPLAAKSVGALLGKKTNEHAWRNILDRDEWKIQNETDDIIPALRLSYNHLPDRLQQLFSYCALFPKGYKFDKEQLIRMWIALGFVTHERIPLGDAASYSFDELVYGSFFQKEERYFILHDLMHDVAQEVSAFQCLTIAGPDPQEASQSVHLIRHVGIWTEMVYNEGNMERNETFEEKLDKIQDGDILKSLESFMLVGTYDENFSAKFAKTLEKLQYVRLLRLSMHFNIDALLSSVTKFIHLRYLELRYTSQERKPLPEAICKLYHLLLLDIMHWSGLDDLPKAMSNLVCLRYLLVPGSGSLHSRISRVGQMKFLQELSEFRVQEEKGFEIAQLGSLSEIRGSLSILDLDNVKTKQKASEARIKDKKHLRTLSLSWGSASARESAAVQKEVIEGLKPHDRLAHLHIINYAGASPSWIAMKGLESLHLHNCMGIDVLPPFEEMECLQKLSLIGMSSLRDVDIDMGLEDDELELSEVEIASCSALTSIRLHFGKILTKFDVKDCVALSSIEGLPSSGQRKHYVIQGCPQLPADTV
ncbi:hypothetical protein CFC21_095934 [Triticum aestivum]|uniref:Uncharacterized protein n=2 Tax=Triticum aestivum TaxID=4565 RepID=A0A3B6RCY6_WHEAT|nr:putative disease resistance protein RGA3 [Triticum aestivum]KAF7093527.1 hypothetical protein CFC21_095934 [Triticum aestivum]